MWVLHGSFDFRLTLLYIVVALLAPRVTENQECYVEDTNEVPRNQKDFGKIARAFLEK